VLKVELELFEIQEVFGSNMTYMRLPLQKLGKEIQI
jgi:hypothetical protein